MTQLEIDDSIVSIRYARPSFNTTTNSNNNGNDYHSTGRNKQSKNNKNINLKKDSIKVSNISFLMTEVFLL